MGSLKGESEGEGNLFLLQLLLTCSVFSGQGEAWWHREILFRLRTPPFLSTLFIFLPPHPLLSQFLFMFPARETTTSPAQRERISFARAAHEVTTRARSRFLASRCHCFASWFLKDDAVSSVAAVLAQLHVYSDQRHSGKPALSCLICRKKLALVAIYSWLRKTTDG